MSSQDWSLLGILIWRHVQGREWLVLFTIAIDARWAITHEQCRTETVIGGDGLTRL